MTTSRPSRLLTALLAGGAVVVALQADSAGAVPVPKPRPASAPAKADAKPNATAAAPRAATPSARFAVAAGEPISSADIAALKEAVNAARRGKTAQAEDLQKTISDPVARKLVEWAILRSDGPRASTCAATWPSSPKIRAGRPSACCAAAPRRRCGQTASIPLSCARSSPRNGPPPPRASSRSPARCCCRATAPAHRASCARPGAMTSSRATSRAWPSTSSRV